MKLMTKNDLFTEKLNKNDLNSRDFYESRERYALTNFYQIYLKPEFDKDYVSSLHLATTFKQSTTNITSYDAVIYLKDKITLQIIFKFIIEVKYRDAPYETLMLEKSKYKGLLKEYKDACKFKTKEEDLTLLYINFDSTGTYIYNLLSDKITSFINNKKNKVTEKQVKTTYVLNDKKIDKDIYYLPKSLAALYPYTLTTDYNLIYNMTKTVSFETKQAPIKKYYSLFND